VRVNEWGRIKKPHFLFQMAEEKRLALEKLGSDNRFM